MKYYPKVQSYKYKKEINKIKVNRNYCNLKLIKIYNKLYYSNSPLMSTVLNLSGIVVLILIRRDT